VGSKRRVALVVVATFAALFGLALATGVVRIAEARPGGGQNYRSSSSSSSRSSSYGSSTSRSYGSSSSSRSSSRSSWSGSSSSYSGSSSSYSSSSSSSSSDGCSTGSLVVGLIFVVAIVAFVLWVVAEGKKAQQVPRASVQVSDEERQAGLAALKAEDPDFDEASFAARCRQMMLSINKAWHDGNMGPVRRFISDGVYVRFQTQLALLRAQKLRNAMADARAVAAEVVAAESDPNWDTVHVKVVGEARDTDVASTLSAEEAAEKAKSAPLSRYEEVWSFVRRRGRRTKAGVPMAAAFEGKCANCGNELPSGEVVRCEVCKALTNSGEHDWVLAEITQPEEWVPHARATSDILDKIREHDPTVSVQELEDRASVLFWKWIEARATGKRTRLERFCFQQGKPDATKANLAKVAVGSAEVVGVERTPDGLDQVSVAVKWSASFDGGEPSGRENLVVMVRSAEAKSTRGLSCLDCPNCGGPLVDSDSVSCDYCKEPLTGGKREWALKAVV
jgi:hypothetical protein